jgi:hypothetical protein
MMNAISYLFPRETISPDIIRNIMLYSLDSYGPEGVMGKRGTSSAAMMFLSNWLNGYGKIGDFHIASRYLTGKSVYLGEGGQISDTLHRGGVVVLRLLLEGGHYVLLTGESDGKVFMFDPYYEEEPFKEKDIIVTEAEPFAYNRIVPEHYFNKEIDDTYALGPYDDREAVILFNKDTELTPDQTIEYFI